jgi:hypothetical protein
MDDQRTGHEHECAARQAEQPREVTLDTPYEQQSTHKTHTLRSAEITAMCAHSAMETKTKRAGEQSTIRLAVITTWSRLGV